MTEFNQSLKDENLKNVIDPPTLILSTEQRKRIEENRLKAKAKLIEKQKQKLLEFELNSLETTNDKLGDTEKVLPPMKKFANYADYDFSKMVDTRGGFLIEESEINSKKRKERVLEPEEPPLNSFLDDNPKCKECKTVEIDYQFHSSFRINICKNCKEKFPEKYSLLTKTEAKEEVLPHLSRPNPHKSTWNDMRLYLREQVLLKFRAKNLDKEFEKREKEKKARKDKKFKNMLSDLRKRTRTDKLEKSRRKEHKHEYGMAIKDPKTGVTTQTCNGCGLKIEVDIFYRHEN
ncbi:1280_t:CDS:2 [Diversispora eburnea]|uniref:1280_t:CDS:1 n=1 Tax=Diversispora eburnea TaxID=1213867 RepID=A0A9N9ADD8_9GLOM|nr:1280_t:CDS:2 [Diversispora eburnea]